VSRGNDGGTTPQTTDGDEVQIDDSGAVQGARSLEGLLRFFFSEPAISIPHHSLLTPPSTKTHTTNIIS
jgi:hypothetical protein